MPKNKAIKILLTARLNPFKNAINALYKGV